MADRTAADPAPPAPPVVADPPIIAIDGVDGSGKSTFADRLVAGLADAGWPAVLFRVDDFRCPVDWGRAERGEAEADLYYHQYYDLALLERTLDAFAAGAPAVAIPRFDARAECLDGERSIRLAGARVAVVEGVFALRVSAAARGLVIYLDVDGEEARRRLIARDLARGRARAVIEHRLQARYQPAQAAYHRACDPARRADVVVAPAHAGAAGTVHVAGAPAAAGVASASGSASDGVLPQALVATRRELGRLPAELRAVLDRLLPPAASRFSP